MVLDTNDGPSLWARHQGTQKKSAQEKQKKREKKNHRALMKKNKGNITQKHNLFTFKTVIIFFVKSMQNIFKVYYLTLII